MKNYLETQRLILRRWKRSDLEDMYEYTANPNVAPNAGWQPHMNKSATRQLLRSFVGQKEIWAIELKDNSKVIGSIGLHDDRIRLHTNCRMIGYVLSEKYWGHGYATEACKEVISYAFKVLKLDVLSVYHYPHNAKSKRIIEKCGFKYEGTLRHASKSYKGEAMDECAYTMLKREYEKLLQIDL